MATAAATHVWLDKQGVAWIDDTNTKVVEVVLDHTAQGLSPAEIHSEYSYLSLGQIHAALAYYHDNKLALDAEIEERFRKAEALEAQAGGSPARERLRRAAGTGRGQLP